MPHNSAAERKKEKKKQTRKIGQNFLRSL